MFDSITVATDCINKYTSFLIFFIDHNNKYTYPFSLNFSPLTLKSWHHWWTSTTAAVNLNEKPILEKKSYPFKSCYAEFILGNIKIHFDGLVCKTAVSPFLTHWRYCSLALNHRFLFPIISWQWDGTTQNPSWPWPDDTRSQGISSHGSYLLYPWNIEISAPEGKHIEAEWPIYVSIN